MLFSRNIHYITHGMEYIVLDIESVGLYGEPFMLAAILYDTTRNEADKIVLHRDRADAQGSVANRKWIDENIPKTSYPINVSSTKAMRDAFWKFYEKHMNITPDGKKSPTIVVDCGFPVETDFLYRCVMDDVATREFQGLYPVLDVMSRNDTTIPRTSNELPQHDPLNDVRHSARKFFMTLSLDFFQ
jgi:hypothetical protein